MKKYIANVITGSRILFSVPLLFIPLSSAWFYALYLFCAFTDMIDGAIARKTEAVSKFGARLDTASDFIFMLVCCVKILPQIHIPTWADFAREVSAESAENKGFRARSDYSLLPMCLDYTDCPY